MDQGVVRTDQNNIVDCMGNFGSDGIVGPHMEKEGSFYTIREVWSPVQIKYWDSGKPTIQNYYDFTNLKDCQFSYKFLQMPAYGEKNVKVLKEGKLPSPDVAPGQTFRFDLPKTDADVIQLTAIDPKGQEIFTWNYKYMMKAGILNSREHAEIHMY